MTAPRAPLQSIGAMRVYGSATMTAVAINNCTAGAVRKRAARAGDKRARRGRAWGHAHMLRAGTAVGEGEGCSGVGGGGRGAPSAVTVGGAG